MNTSPDNCHEKNKHRGVYWNKHSNHNNSSCISLNILCVYYLFQRFSLVCGLIKGVV